MRVIVGQFCHETNTFSVQKADTEDFHKLFCYRGNEVRERLAGTSSEIAGFLDVADREGWSVIHTVATFANPSGKVTDRAWHELGGIILDAARANPDVDGVLLALHGAMVTDTHDDAEGQLLEELRGILGPSVPIAVTLDLHANVSDRMAAHASALVSYRTYPHVDMRECGRAAAELLRRAAAGEIHPVTVVARRPQLLGVAGGRTDTGPMLDVLARARVLEQEPGVLSISINAGFAKADIVDAGPAVTVTGDGDSPRWRAMAEELMDMVWASRAERAGAVLTPAEAAAQAAAWHGEAGRPLVIADTGDNPGGGAYGDSTSLLQALLEAGVRDVALGSIRDADAVAAMAAAGVGAEITVDIGGKVDPSFGGPPLRLTGRVMHVGPGDYVHEGPMWAGLAASLGQIAVLRTAGIDILCATNLLQLLDRNMFRIAGIEPVERRIVVVKSSQHFRAAFGPIAGEILVVDGGGLTTRDYTRMPFERLRRPIFPLDLQ
ncbi:microcystin degradation protein MlrC [Stella humosa]|uniref:Microcystinase C n=1 Tax=Stella humosa TaxID=94 RepID=A0A3N1KXW0_9PROT|nr:M81 family metallopeptidase [Stella humosa]ROP83619.1 microcystin degradation protein MlrC [Stella humosa]BBK33107.1 microcystinase C [Stella humosa]